MVMKKFLEYFSESSMFDFIVTEPISELSFGLFNIGSLVTLYISRGVVLFPSYNLKDHSEF